MATAPFLPSSDIEWRAVLAPAPLLRNAAQPPARECLPWYASLPVPPLVGGVGGPPLVCPPLPSLPRIPAGEIQPSTSSPRRSLAASTRVKVGEMGKLPKFSLARLVMCGGGYQRLSSQEYLRLGLCLPDSCPDCAEGGSGHYVKNDKMVSCFILLALMYFEKQSLANFQFQVWQIGPKNQDIFCSQNHSLHHLPHLIIHLQSGSIL